MSNDRSEERIIEEGKRLSEALSGQQPKTAGGRWRCPGDLRSRIVAYAVGCSADGESHRRIAGRLGLKQPTLSRWVARARISHAVVRPVAIIPSGRPAGAPVAGPTPRELRLVTPRGFVVEGLDLERLASLLQVLG